MKNKIDLGESYDEPTPTSEGKKGKRNKPKKWYPTAHHNSEEDLGLNRGDEVHFKGKVLRVSESDSEDGIKYEYTFEIQDAMPGYNKRKGKKSEDTETEEKTNDRDAVTKGLDEHIAESKKEKE